MAKYRLIIEGDVQQIGYREYIKKVAIKLNIKGSAKNMDDGSVEVYCDVLDELFDQFKAQILSYPAIQVTNIKIIKDSDPEYSAPTTDFKAFKVIRGEDEVAETLSVMAATCIAMLQDIKDINQKINSGFDTLSEKN